MVIDPVLKKYMTMAVPRYTSYPTAPYFNAGIDADQYRQWLADLEIDKPVSLYVHVPFCKQVCWYCGCNMKLAARYEPIARYVETLLKEVALVKAAIPVGLAVSHLHFGGGTPTVMDPADLSRVMAAIRKAFTFTTDAEIAIECDPRTLGDDMAHRIGALGFNRASFGVQEFNPLVQAAINRIQPPDMVESAITRLREAGVSGINFDLIYGLPHQTTEMTIESAKRSVAMAPDRFALFGYAHVPWMAKKQKMILEDALPGPVERLDQATATAQVLRDAGYTQIGLDHFALPGDTLSRAMQDGTLRRNFQGYTTDNANALIPLGATSIGQTPNGFIQNIVETGAWARSVEDGVLPVAKGLAYSGDDLLRAHVIEQIMCYGKVDLAEAAADFGSTVDYFDAERTELLSLADDGLVSLDRNTVTLTESGTTVVRVVASVFDSYFHSKSARHSVAV